MTTTADERSSTRQRTAWVCDNCHAHTASVRKRCTECGTSRY
jgi:hypothetical protein